MKPNEIKSIRYKNGLSQKAVAERLGVSVQTYACKENGKYSFRDKEKIKMKEILKIPWDDWNRIFYNGELPERE